MWLVSAVFVSECQAVDSGTCEKAASSAQSRSQKTNPPTGDGCPAYLPAGFDFEGYGRCGKGERAMSRIKKSHAVAARHDQLGRHLPRSSHLSVKVVDSSYSRWMTMAGQWNEPVVVGLLKAELLLIEDEREMLARSLRNCTPSQAAVLRCQIALGNATGVTNKDAIVRLCIESAHGRSGLGSSATDGAPG